MKLEKKKGYYKSAVSGLRVIQIISLASIVTGFIWATSDILMTTVLIKAPVTPMSILLMVYGVFGTFLSEISVRILARIQKKIFINTQPISNINLRIAFILSMAFILLILLVGIVYVGMIAQNAGILGRGTASYVNATMSTVYITFGAEGTLTLILVAAVGILLILLAIAFPWK